MEKIIEISPAFDKRHPDLSKNCGIHGCDILFVLKGELGAINFIVYTNWHLSHVVVENKNKPWSYFQPTGGYITCEYTGGGCYSVDSSIDLFSILVSGGTPALWSELEEIYKSKFGDLK
jgi:hypothetical protein